MTLSGHRGVLSFGKSPKTSLLSWNSKWRNTTSTAHMTASCIPRHLSRLAAPWVASPWSAVKQKQGFDDRIYHQKQTNPNSSENIVIRACMVLISFDCHERDSSFLGPCLKNMCCFANNFQSPCLCCNLGPPSWWWTWKVLSRRTALPGKISEMHDPMHMNLHLFIDWMTDWLTNWSISWLKDSLISWLIRCLIFNDALFSLNLFTLRCILWLSSWLLDLFFDFASRIGKLSFYSLFMSFLFFPLPFLLFSLPRAHSRADTLAAAASGAARRVGRWRTPRVSNPARRASPRGLPAKS